MNKSFSFFSALAVYLTQVVGMCNIYMFFTSLQNEGYERIEMWPWLLFSILTFTIIHLFIKKERSFTHVVVLGVLCFLVTIVVMTMNFIHVTGTVAWLIAWLFIGFSSFIGSAIHFKEINQQVLLLCCEFPSVGIGFLLLMDSSDNFYYPPYFAVLTIGVLIMAFLALTLSKLETKEGLYHNKIVPAISTTLLSFASMGAIATLFVKFALNGAAQVTSKTSSFVYYLASTAVNLINSFIFWFFSLFPEADKVEMEMEVSETISAMGGDSGGEIDYGMLNIVMVVSIIVIVVVALVVLFFILRKTKLYGKTKKIVYHRPKVVTKKESFFKKIRLFIKSKWQTLVFNIILVKKRNTPKGCVLILAKIGKKIGVEMEIGESYGSYILRLKDLVSPVDETVANSFSKLSTIINETLYSPCETTEKLSKKEYKKIRVLTKKLKVPKPKTINNT